MSEIDKLIEMIKDSKKIVFFGGAGVSTESGLKDFRSSDGLYNEKYKSKNEKLSIFFKNRNIVSNVDDTTNNLYFDEYACFLVIDKLIVPSVVGVIVNVLPSTV